MNYRLSPTAKHHIVPGNDIVLTSTAGVISSTDEFYGINGRHSRLTVAGINMRYEPQLSSRIQLEKMVFLGARVMTANRLATSSRAWAKFMKRDPQSAQQWLLIDRKVLKGYNSFQGHEVVEAMIDEGHVEHQAKTSTQSSPPVEEVAGLFWIVDNVPGRLHGEEVTAEALASAKELQLQGHPHFRETLEESRLPASGPEFQYLKESQEHNNNRHSIQFYVIASGRTDYRERLSLNSLGEGDSQETSSFSGRVDREAAAAAAMDGGDAVEQGEDKGPTWSALEEGGFFSQWTWS